uniref:Uncharacterized protein n=1 Tax=Tanacetum cinerariifolium TaxID=118510 RepID=A0A699HRH7_TANCI|nr:hypothetical protein [Tanacetum cinerariifolium]
MRKALVEPYTVQLPTTAPSVFVKVDRKRRKRQARMLEKNTRFSFDDDDVDVDDVADDEPDFCVISLEEWVYTSRAHSSNEHEKKEPIRQSQIDMKDIPLLEFHEHLDAWFELMWEFRPKDTDWAISSSYFCSFVMRGDILGWVCNGVRYPVNWADVGKVFFSINEPNDHYCLGVLHIRTGVITFLYYKCGLEVFEVKDEDDVQYFVNEVCRLSKIVQKLCVRKIKERKQVKLDVLPVNGFDLNVSLFPNDYNNQTAILPKWQFNTFTNMPIPPLPPQPYIQKSHVEYHGILVGDEFCNKNKCMYTIGVKSLREAFQYAVIKSCPQRFSVKCVQPDCQWNVYTRKVKDGNTFIVSNCKDINTCSKTQINPNHRNATTKLLGNYLETSLLAVGMDGNNQILPLAIGVSQGKTGESWTWFLTKLEEQIGEPPNLPIVVTKLEEAGIEKWSRAYFPTSHYNYMTSNSVESINSLTKIVRRVPITMLVEYYRDILQRWYSEKRHKYEEASENELSNWAAAKPTQRRKTVRTNSLFQTQTTDGHLSKAARMDEERLRNRRVYMDWDDVQAIQEHVTTEGMEVEEWQAVQGRLDLYNPCINFLSHAENDNYYQSQPHSSIQSNNQQ